VIPRALAIPAVHWEQDTSLDRDNTVLIRKQEWRHVFSLNYINSRKNYLNLITDVELVPWM
jgi:hypothetical protein